MKMQQLKPVLWMSLITISMGGLFGCQQQEQPQAQTVVEQKQDTIPLIQAKRVAVEGARTLSCEKEGCTRFDLQTIQSNVAWIDDYFLERLKRAEPVAFKVQQTKATEDEVNSVEQRSMTVSLVGQRYDLATFVIKTYNFKTGAEHGLYHTEYVNLDLNKQKRIALEDILQKGSEQKLLDTLYDSNLVWLNARGINKEQLKLSDNFYFGANGLVLVYPLYELADYTMGMPELKISYTDLAKLIKPEYLTGLVATTP
ncbi:RsiV family protein [Acinetobacter thermotolerans]|uniref:RsiV family protein n=1 Tax=Acinetobacter thermotolerans TaxID=3151487 RepID=UPI00325B3EDD